MQKQKTVFISYRRTNVYTARAVYQYLVAHNYDVFLDSESIDSGAFDRVILNQIAARAHFVVILTPSAIERCLQVGDWLRREIEHAIDLKRNIVPMMFEGFRFEDVQRYLTGKLALLQAYNAINVPSDYFDEAMSRLTSRFLEKPLDMVLHPTPVDDQNEVTRHMNEAASQPVVLEHLLTAEEYFEQGYLLSRRGDYSDAIARFTNAIECNPLDDLYYVSRGLVRQLSKDQEGAMVDFATAIGLNPESAPAYYNRGNVHYNRDEYEKAIEDYDTALTLNPHYSEAFHNRGVARAKLNQLEGALSDYNEALRLRSDYAEAYHNRGIVRKSLGDIAGALADYEAALRINPDYESARNHLQALKGRTD